MNVGELVDEFREQADDVAGKLLWTTPVIIRRLNEAQREAARRARCIHEALDARYCLYTVKVDQQFIELDPGVIEIRHAHLEIPNEDDPEIVQNRDIEIITVGDLNRSRPCWRDDVANEPSYGVVGVQSGYLRLTPASARACKLRLEVARLPKCDLTKPEQKPEIPEHLHVDLVHWALYKGFLKVDSDTNDLQRANAALAAFERVFGPPSSAIDEVHFANRTNAREHSRTNFC